MSARDRASLKRMVDREVRKAKARLRGVIAALPRQSNFNTSGATGYTWVTDIDVGQGRLLVDVPIKINGPQARLYAKLGMPVMLERDSGQRWVVIGPADRAPAVATVGVYDEDLNTTSAGLGFGITVTREPFQFYKGDANQLPTFFFNPATDTDVILWTDAGFYGPGRDMLEADGAAVRLLLDQSASGNYAIQGTTANRPLMRYNTAGSNLRPAVDFQDGTDILTFNQNILGEVLSIFVMLRRDSTGAVNRTALNTREYAIRVSNAGTDQWSVGAGGGANLSGFTLGNTDFVLIEAICSAFNNIAMYQNGVAGNVGTLAATGSALASSNIGALAGGTEDMDGRVAEVLILDRAVNTTDRQKIEAYFNQKYFVRFSRWNNQVTPFPAIIRRDAQGNPI